MPDPHLRQAMREIRALLRRYRIGGAITLVSKTHAEWGYEFPYWSVVQQETGPDGQPGLRVRTFRTFYRTRAEQKQALEESLHCLLQIRDIGAQTYVMFHELFEQIQEQTGLAIDHHPYSGFEPGEAP